MALGLVDVIARLMAGNNPPSGGGLSAILVFRVLRILRLVRQVRLFRMFQDLWTIVQSLYQSLFSVFWVSVLLLVVTYTMGVLLTMISQNLSERVNAFWPDKEVYVGSSMQGMITMVLVWQGTEWQLTPTGLTVTLT